MYLLPLLHNHELRAESPTKVGCAVPRHGQARAAFGSIVCEGRHDERSTRCQCTMQDAAVRLDLKAAEEVEHGSVVPEVVGTRWLPFQDVSDQPSHGSIGAEALARRVERGRRESSTVRSLKPLETSRSTSVEAPPPTSTIPASGATPSEPMNAKETTGSD